MYGLTEWRRIADRHIYILKLFIDYTLCGVHLGSPLVYQARPGREMVWLDDRLVSPNSPQQRCKQYNMNIHNLYVYLLHVPVKALHIPSYCQEGKVQEG